MYTSYFANLRLIPPELRPVAIAVGVPRWYKGDRDLRLAPTRAMLTISEQEYDRLYDEILARLDPAQVAADLGDNAVMLCWEKPGERCHRRRVAEWIEQATGQVVTELGFERQDIREYTSTPRKQR